MSEPPPPPATVTELLHQLQDSTAPVPEVRERLYGLLYDELRNIARGLMRAQSPGHTLQPTALVHEAYLKLVDHRRIKFESRSHFLGIAARAMRQVLVDHARRRDAAKRGGGWDRVPLDETVPGREGIVPQLLDLDRSLHRLARLDERLAQVVECRVFGGLKHEEIARALSVSERTVAKDWAVARRWLAKDLDE